MAPHHVRARRTTADARDAKLGIARVPPRAASTTGAMLGPGTPDQILSGVEAGET